VVKDEVIDVTTPVKANREIDTPPSTKVLQTSTRANPSQSPVVQMTPTQKSDLNVQEIVGHMRRMSLESNPPNQSDPRAMFFSPEQARLKINSDKLKNALRRKNKELHAMHIAQGGQMTESETDAFCVRHLAFCHLYPADVLSMAVEEYDRLNQRARQLSDSGEVDYEKLAAEHFMFREGWRPF
jgi:hypothetical protein